MNNKNFFWGCEEDEKEAFDKIDMLELDEFSMKWIGGKSFADIHIFENHDCIGYMEMKIRGSLPLSVLKKKGWPFYWPERNERSELFHEYKRNKELLEERHWKDALCCCIQKGENIFYVTTAENVAK